MQQQRKPRKRNNIRLQVTKRQHSWVLPKCFSAICCFQSSVTTIDYKCQYYLGKSINMTKWTYLGFVLLIQPLRILYIFPYLKTVRTSKKQVEQIFWRKASEMKKKCENQQIPEIGHVQKYKGENLTALKTNRLHKKPFEIPSREKLIISSRHKTALILCDSFPKLRVVSIQASVYYIKS